MPFPRPIWHDRWLSVLGARSNGRPGYILGAKKRMTVPSRLALGIVAIAILPIDLPGRAAQAPPHLVRRTPVAAPAPVVPAGAIIPLEIKNTINSKTAYEGETVYCESIYPVTDGDRLVVPAHSFVKGSVTQIVRPGRIKGKAQLALRFESLTLPDGTTRPVNATVYSIAGTRLAESKVGEESTEPASGENAVAGGAEDAVIDATGLGGVSPLTAASQGVGGVMLMLVTRGKTIILRPGTTLEIQLTAPLNFAQPAAIPPQPKTKSASPSR